MPANHRLPDNKKSRERGMASFITYRVLHRGSPRLGMTNWCMEWCNRAREDRIRNPLRADVRSLSSGEAFSVLDIVKILVHAEGTLEARGGWKDLEM